MKWEKKGESIHEGALDGNSDGEGERKRKVKGRRGELKDDRKGKREGWRG